jgi:hypothetical protein
VIELPHNVLSGCGASGNLQCDCCAKKNPTRIDNCLVSHVLILIFLYCLEFAADDIIHISTIFVKMGKMQYHVPYSSGFLRNLDYLEPAGMTKK